MRSAKVWCQLASGNKLAKPYVFLLDSADQCLVAKPMVSAKLGDCFQLQLTDLSPGTRYRYFIGDEHGTPLSETLTIRTQPLWQYRTDPPELNFLLGSCTYVNEPEYDRPGEPYGGYGISIPAQEDFDAMLWLGDNVYLREADVELVRFCSSVTHTRSLQKCRLLSKGSHYAIWGP